MKGSIQVNVRSNAKCVRKASRKKKFSSDIS
nr:unnamed protein product [Callosobruchus chinensis]